jgi:RNA polymerase sigma-70 factor, ECF subfamily
MKATIADKTTSVWRHNSPSMGSDEELLSQYAECGDPKAFEELVARHEGEMYSYLRHYLGDPESAEDAFQATFLQVHLKCRQFEPGRRVRPWLYTIATHQAIDLLRRNRRHKAVSLSTATFDHSRCDQARPMQELLVGREAEPGQRMQSSEDEQRVRRSLERLPDRLKQVLVMIVFQRLRYREVAEILGIPLGTVKSRVHAAITRLNEAMENAPTRTGRLTAVGV